MTIDRKALKLKGQESLQNNYWKACFMTGLMMALSYGTVFTALTDFVQGAPAVIRDIHENVTHMGRGWDMKVVAVMVILAFGILLLTTIFKICVNIFVKNPMEVGVRLFMKKGLDPDTPGMISDVTYSFDHEFKNTVKCMFLVQLAEFLWGLILIVPGVIKSYEYRLVPYLLSEYSGLTPIDAMKKSTEMMKGYKKEAFLLDLSFVPWHIAGILTLGVLEVFYVEPYRAMTNAAFYEKIKANKTEE